MVYHGTQATLVSMYHAKKSARKWTLVHPPWINKLNTQLNKQTKHASQVKAVESATLLFMSHAKKSARKWMLAHPTEKTHMSRKQFMKSHKRQWRSRLPYLGTRAVLLFLSHVEPGPTVWHSTAGGRALLRWTDCQGVLWGCRVHVLVYKRRKIRSNDRKVACRFRPCWEKEKKNTAEKDR